MPLRTRHCRAELLSTGGLGSGGIASPAERPVRSCLLRNCLPWWKVSELGAKNRRLFLLPMRTRRQLAFYVPCRSGPHHHLTLRAVHKSLRLPLTPVRKTDQPEEMPETVNCRLRDFAAPMSSTGCLSRCGHAAEWEEVLVPAQRCPKSPLVTTTVRNAITSMQIRSTSPQSRFG